MASETAMSQRQDPALHDLKQKCSSLEAYTSSLGFKGRSLMPTAASGARWRFFGSLTRTSWALLGIELEGSN